MIARLFAIIVCCLPAPLVAQSSLTLVCLDEGRAVEACQDLAERFATASGDNVTVVSASAVGRRSLLAYRSLFDIESPRVDVVQFPMTWSYALAPDLLNLSAATTPLFLPAFEQAGIVSGRRVGLPQYFAVTVMYLREDVFGSPPTIWQDVYDSLLTAPSDGATGLSFGAAGGGLFPFFIDWIYSLGAAGLSDSEGVRNALKSLDDALGLVATRALASASRSEAIEDFVSGSTAALIARSTARPRLANAASEGGVQTVIRPRSASASDTSLLAAVWLVGVSAHSRSPEAARRLAEFMVSEAAQTRAAIEFEQLPTARNTYADPSVISANEVLHAVSERTGRLKVGPVETYGLAYLELAESVAEAVRVLIQGSASVDETATAVAAAVRRARRQLN